MLRPRVAIPASAMPVPPCARGMVHWRETRGRDLAHQDVVRRLVHYCPRHCHRTSVCVCVCVCVCMRAGALVLAYNIMSMISSTLNRPAGRAGGQ